MVAVLVSGAFIADGGGWCRRWRPGAWNGLDQAFRSSALAMPGQIPLHLPAVGSP